MSKRNLILLIIVMVAVVIAVFGFLYFRGIPAAPKEESEGTNFISRFNPFASSKPSAPETAAPSVDVTGYEPGSDGEMPKLQLIKVSSMPVVGFGVYQKERFKEVPMIVPAAGAGSEPEEKTSVSAAPTPPPTEFVPALRYVDRATGNIYQTFADKIEERKFSETTIPKVYEAYFGNRGESVIMRYLKGSDRTIETFVGALPKEHLGADMSGNNAIVGSFLPDNVKDISVSSDGLKIFYLFNSGDGVIGATLNLLDNKKVQVFDSPFTEWLTQWPGGGSAGAITLSTKPSANVPGYMYKINLVNKNLTKVLGNINGLTTLASPDEKLVLYGDNNLSLYVYNVDSKNSDLLGVKTMPEKCVWGALSDVIYCAVPKSVDIGAYPDAWYQGEVTFYDRFWKIDIESGSTTLMFDPAAVTGREEIDGIKLALDENENYLFFVNKKDSYLWKAELR